MTDDEVQPLHVALKADGPSGRSAWLTLNGQLVYARSATVRVAADEMIVVTVDVETDGLDIDLTDPRIVVNDLRSGRCWTCDKPDGHDEACEP